jgi:beta-lactamase superfamily II metal-dependent hydrolase
VDLLVLGSVNSLRVIGAATLAGLWPVKEIRFAEGWHAPPVGARRCDRPLLWRRDAVEFQLQPAGAERQFCLLRVAPLKGPAVLMAERLDRPAAQQLVEHAPDWLRAEVVIAPRRGSLRALDRHFAQATGAQTILVSARVFDAGMAEAVARAWGVARSQVYATATEGALTLRMRRDEPVRVEGYRSTRRAGVWQTTAD